MDLFKVRYKKFRKPIIDENLLAHLFEPSILENNPFNNYVVQYVRSEDPAHQKYDSRVGYREILLQHGFGFN